MSANDGKPKSKSRPRVFRVRGIPLGTCKDAEQSLHELIRNEMTIEEESSIKVKLECIPACDSQSFNALVSFTGGIPSFLEELEEDPLASYEMEMGDEDISFDAHFHGFTQLYAPKEPVSLDIIAITGLAGHAYGSWTGRGNLARMWLRDFFVKDFSHCRTLIYGYDSQLSTLGVKKILDYSRGFLEDLKAVRNTEESRKRPIVFLAHSFGGILLAHALVKAIMTDQRDHPVIAALHKSTYAILFFGTPHKGLFINDLLEMFEKPGSMITNDSNSNLIYQIRTNSDILESQLASFRDIARDYKLVSFYELNQTRTVEMNQETQKWGRTGAYVTKVDANSALLGFPESMEAKIPVHKDHSEMVKFNNRTDDTYKSVVNFIKEFEETAGEAVALRHRVNIPTKQPISTVPFERDLRYITRKLESGEDILEAIGKQFTQSKTHTRVSIVGLGGVGKSQIAIEYSYRLHQDRPSIWVFWISCRSSAAFEQGYASTVRRLEIPGFDDPKKNPLDLLNQWLLDARNGPWLMILDNADTIDMFRSDVGGQSSYASYIPQASHGAVLLTTRNRAVAFELTTGEYVNTVGPMKEEEALALIAARLPNECEKAEVLHLARELDYIPLAISQATAYIRENSPRMNISRYLALYHQNEYQSELLSEDTGDVRRDPDVPNSVIKTWRTSFEQIKATSLDSMKLLALMAVLDRQGIFEYLLLKPFQGNQLSLERALSVLLKYSFIVAQKNETESFEMHRLVQLATNTWLRKDNSLNEVQGSAIRLMAACFPKGHYENVAKCQSLLPHVAKVLQYQYDVNDLPLARSLVLQNLGILRMTQGLYKEAERNLREAVELALRRRPEDDEVVLDRKHNLAACLFLLGRYNESSLIDSQVLQARRKLFGNKHEQTISSMSNLAITYHLQGRWDEFEKLESEALELRKELWGAEHPSTIDKMENFASIYMARERYKEMEELLLKTSAARKKLYGAEHPSTLDSMTNLAAALSGQGRLEEAEKMALEVLEISKRILGPTHPGMLGNMNNLAFIYDTQGRLQEAETLRKEVLVLSTATQGPKHPRTLISMSSLASSYVSQGRWEEAVRLQVQVLQLRREVLGAEHPETLSAMHNLACSLMSMGFLLKACQFMEECVRLRRKVFGADDPKLKVSQDGLNQWISRIQRSRTGYLSERIVPEAAQPVPAQNTTIETDAAGERKTVIAATDTQATSEVPSALVDQNENEE